MLLDSSHHRGEIACLKVQIAANKKGYITSLPSIEGSPYDVVIDDGKSLSRCQVKYLEKKTKYKSYKLNIQKGGKKRKFYSSDEIDCIAIYIADEDLILMLYKKDFHKKTTITLAVNPKAKKYWKNYIWPK